MGLSTVEEIDKRGVSEVKEERVEGFYGTHVVDSELDLWKGGMRWLSATG